MAWLHFRVVSIMGEFSRSMVLYVHSVLAIHVIIFIACMISKWNFISQAVGAFRDLERWLGEELLLSSPKGNVNLFMDIKENTEL